MAAYVVVADVKVVGDRRVFAHLQPVHVVPLLLLDHSDGRHLEKDF